MMSRARRWIAVSAMVCVLSGCASGGGETSETEGVLWTLFFLATIVAGIIGARLLVEQHRRQ